MTTASTITESRPIVELIPLNLIDPSTTNPRKTIIQSEVEELAADFLRRGILQPVLVRPSTTKTGRFDLVFGEKRFKAAKIAKYDVIPSSIREMTDSEVLEAQIVENAKRSDISPLEEAEAYERLQKTHGYSVDDIAKKIGKSRASVYARLKLRDLSPDAKKALADGKLTPSTALLAARIKSPKAQSEAIKSMTGKDKPVSARAAQKAIKEKKAAEKQTPAQKKAAQKAKADRGAANLLMGKIINKCEMTPTTDAWSRLFIAAVVEQASQSSVAAVVRRRGFTGSDDRLTLRRKLATMKVYEARGLALELVIHGNIGAFAKFYGVSVKGGAK